MNNKRNTMRDLMISVLALLMSCSMLVGTTFAWFTDSVTTGGNLIKSGTLDIVLEKWDVATSTWVDVEGEKIFNYDKWEPGYTQKVLLRIVNEGNLALKWQAAITTETQLSELAEVINVYASATTGKTADLEANAVAAFSALDRSNLEAAVTAGTLIKKNLAELNQASGAAALAPKGELAESEASYLVLVLQMDTAAGNEYKGLDLGGTFDLTILATQATVEEDFFDNQYDANAQFTDELEGGNAAFDGTYNLSEDHNDNLTVNAGVEADINLNDNAINGAVTNNGDAKISNGTINGTVYNDGGNLSVEDATLNNTESRNYGSQVTNGAYTVFTDVTIQSTTAAASGGITIRNAEAVFESGTIDIQNVKSRHMFYVGTNNGFAKLTIKDGTFNLKNKTTTSSYLVADGEGAVIIVEGGNFNAASSAKAPVQELNGGEVIIKGGTFKWDPSEWVADGYEAVETDGTWTVSAKA